MIRSPPRRNPKGSKPLQNPLSLLHPPPITCSFSGLGRAAVGVGGGHLSLPLSLSLFPGDPFFSSQLQKMSLLQYPDAAKSENLQVWNNAAFDDATGSRGGCSDVSASAAKLLLRAPPPPPLQPLSANRPDRLNLDLDPIKENRGPAPRKKSPAPTVAAKRAPRVAFKEQADPNVEDEIEKIEKEVERLSARLQELRIKKGESDSHAEKRGRIVPAKFMDPTKQSAAESPAPDRIRQRGVSLGPLEILRSPCPAALLSRKQSSMQKGAPGSRMIEESPATARSRRRGLSLGPLEIHPKPLGKPLRKPEATPPPPPPQSAAQRQRKSSVFTMLQGIEEMSSSPQSRPSAAAKALDTRRGIAKSAGPKQIGVRPRGVVSMETTTGSSVQTLQQKNKLRQAKDKSLKGDKQRSSSASPKSRKQSAAKASELRNGIATAGAAKKPVKRDGDSLSAIKPKALFHGDKLNTAAAADKGPSKSSKFRVVASRYSLAPSRVGGGEPESKRRKWSLPEANTSQLEYSQSTEGAILDDMQADEKMHSTSVGRSPSSVMKVAEMLPRIKTLRCAIESPRDSGCAKRVAELVGRKPYFGVSSFPELNFEEEE